MPLPEMVTFWERELAETVREATNRKKLSILIAFRIGALRHYPDKGKARGDLPHGVADTAVFCILLLQFGC